MKELKPQRPSPQQLYAIEVGNSLKQRGVNTKDPAVQAWLDPNNPFKVRLMDHYFQKLKFQEETNPLTRANVEGFYEGLRESELLEYDPSEADIEAGITLYGELVSDPDIQCLVRDQVKNRIAGHGHAGGIKWKDDLT